jgi:hypothetical protein
VSRKQSALEIVTERTEVADQYLQSARKAMADAAMSRQLNLNQPTALSNDLTIFEMDINDMILKVERTIILYRRLVQDIQEECKHG